VHHRDTENREEEPQKKDQEKFSDSLCLCGEIPFSDTREQVGFALSGVGAEGAFDEAEVLVGP